MKCLHCQGAHEAGSKYCQRQLQENALMEIQRRHKVNFRRARQIQEGVSTSLPGGRFTTHFNVKIKGESLKKKMNPWLVEKCITNHLSEKPKNIRSKDKNTYIVEVTTFQQSRELPLLQKLNDKEVEITENQDMSQSKGLIYIYDYNLSDFESYRKNLMTLNGVTDAQKATWIKTRIADSHAVLISFRSQEPPNYVDIPGEQSYSRVYEYKKRPLHCKKCLEYGHSIKRCDSKVTRCKRCSDIHHIENQCDSQSPKCLQCSDPHVTATNECPVFRRESEILVIQDKEKVSRQQAAVIFNQRNPNQGLNYSAAAKQLLNRSPNNVTDTINQPSTSRSNQQISPNNVTETVNQPSTSRSNQQISTNNVTETINQPSTSRNNQQSVAQSNKSQDNPKKRHMQSEDVDIQNRKKKTCKPPSNSVKVNKDVHKFMTNSNSQISTQQESIIQFYTQDETEIIENITACVNTTANENSNSIGDTFDSAANDPNLTNPQNKSKSDNSLEPFGELESSGFDWNEIVLEHSDTEDSTPRLQLSSSVSTQQKRNSSEELCPPQTPEHFNSENNNKIRNEAREIYDKHIPSSQSSSQNSGHDVLHTLARKPRDEDGSQQVKRSRSQSKNRHENKRNSSQSPTNSYPRSRSRNKQRSPKDKRNRHDYKSDRSTEQTKSKHQSPRNHRQNGHNRQSR